VFSLFPKGIENKEEKRKRERERERELFN